MHFASVDDHVEDRQTVRYLEDVASAYHKFYDACRVLQPGDDQASPLTIARLHLCEATRQVLANGLGLLGVSAPEQLHPAVWPRNCARGQDGVVRVAGLDVRDLAEEFGTPLFVLDEADFRSRCREYAEAFGDPAAVHYAAKAFLSVKLAQWVAEEGLSLDVCSGGELSVALRAGFPPERIAFHGNNKSLAELTAAVRAGVTGLTESGSDSSPSGSEVKAS